MVSTNNQTAVRWFLPTPEFLIMPVSRSRNDVIYTTSSKTTFKMWFLKSFDSSRASSGETMDLICENVAILIKPPQALLVLELLVHSQVVTSRISRRQILLSSLLIAEALMGSTCLEKESV